MRGAWLFLVMGLTGIQTLPSWAGDKAAVVDEAEDIQQQAARERHKEEDLQMMRLELERLKLELETRKTASQIGMTSGESTPELSEKMPVKVAVKGIIVSDGHARAYLDKGGALLSVGTGDKVEERRVKAITSEAVVLVDAAGNEEKVMAP